MWDVGGCRFVAILSEVADKRGIVVEMDNYPEPTPDQYSAYCLVHAIAYSVSTGAHRDQFKAEELLRNGLSAEQVSKEYRHLLLLELSVHLVNRSPAEARECLYEAIELLPENYFAHELLGFILRRNGSVLKGLWEGWKSKRLSNNTHSNAVVSKKLPTDFWIWEVSGFRGWGFDGN